MSSEVAGRKVYNPGHKYQKVNTDQGPAKSSQVIKGFGTNGICVFFSQIF